jgi:hypothetical protein
MRPSVVGAFHEGYVYNVFASTMFADKSAPHRLDIWYSAWALYRNGSEILSGPRHSAIVHAVSMDGNTHVWQKDDAPALMNGPVGAADGYAAFAPCVVRADNGTQHKELLMYYSRGSYAKHHGLSQQYTVGLATSH